MPPPLPFPYPIHIGTDICHAGRILRILRGDNGARFIRRVLAPEELAEAKSAVHRVLEEASVRMATKVVATQFRKGDRPDYGALRGGRDAAWGETLERPAEAEEDDAAESQETTATLQQESSLTYKSAAYFLAGRFAAKEAAFKAHPHRLLGFHDVLILRTRSQPLAALMLSEDASVSWHPRAPIALIKAPKGSEERDQIARVSISHDGDYATATCIGFEARDGQGLDREKGWLSWLKRLWR